MPKIPKRSSCYFGCGTVGPLHRFPRPDSDKERFETWKVVLEKDATDRGNIYIFNQLRICNDHFEKCYISPSNRLTRNAIPTLYLKKVNSIAIDANAGMN